MDMQNNILTVELKELKVDNRNARLHSDRNIEEIMRSIKDLGQHRPFVVQRSTNKILVGNGMYEAMKRLGINEGLVLYVDDDDKTAIRRALADNRTAELAEWDYDILEEMITEMGADINVPGWSDDELFQLVDNDELSKIEKIELKPYKKVHYLITVDVDKHDILVEHISAIKQIGGIDVDSTLN